MVSELKRVWVPGPVIIGAGPSGLATAACLKEKGVPSLIIEKETCIASLWKTKTYDRLKLHLPKKFCALPLMELPPEVPAYPTKHQFISYLDAYAKHFSIKPIFGAEVRFAEYDSMMGFWHVWSNEFEFICQWLIVATGENAEPILPDIPGVSDFKGQILHSSSYENGADLREKKVLVVGCGNSGMEISLDLCDSGAQASLVVRDKLHVLPRVMFGKSTFELSMWLLKWLPVRVVDWLLLFGSRLIVGDTGHFALKRPEVGPLELKNLTGKTPVLDVGTLDKIKAGKIKVVPGINKFTTTGAEFEDGTKAEFDTVVFATGYRSNVPSWLKEGEFFNQEGHPKTPFPNNWKGNNGLYSVGFTKRGLLGVSMDAQKVSEDISRQWHCETKHLCMAL